MKIIYTSDLHGNTNRYEQLYSAAKKCDADVVINGGDMLPAAFNQANYIKAQLNNHFKKFEKLRTHYLCYPGNDDLMIYDSLFDSVCQKYEYIHGIAQKKIIFGGHEFIGMNWVCDYPFQLKDRCRIDDEHFLFERQFGPGVLSTPDGFKEIDDWVSSAKRWIMGNQGIQQ